MRVLVLFLLISTQLVFSQSQSQFQRQWVDSVYRSLSLEEKIAQLYMIPAYSNKNEKHIEELETLVQEHKVGGVIFFQGGPVRQAQITNRLQQKAATKLLIGIDAEWGLSMRLDSTYRYPFNTTLGAIKNTRLIEQLGKQLGKHANRMGIHFFFAPVVDINTNAQNPIIGVRSYGQDPTLVAGHSVAFVKGFQSMNVLATAKHFPGHGDTSKDSHLTLPKLNFHRARLDQIELYPFRELIQNHLMSVMVGHLEVPALEPEVGKPSSLSYNIITNVLKNELGFEGLIMTDALNMKGVSGYASATDVDLQAFLAGNDLLLMSANPVASIQRLKEAYQQGIVSEERLAHSVKKILNYKYKVRLYNAGSQYAKGVGYRPVKIENLYKDLNSTQCDVLHQQLYHNAITVLNNEGNILKKNEKIGYIKLGNATNEGLVARLHNVEVLSTEDLYNDDVLNQYDKIVVGYHKADNAWRKHDFSADELEVLQYIAAKRPTVLLLFAKPYVLYDIDDIQAFHTIVIGYQNNDFAFASTAEVLYGKRKAQGQLPIMLDTPKEENQPLDYPKELMQHNFTAVDSIAQEAISKHYTPSISIVASHNNQVVFEKSYGRYTYDSAARSADFGTVYDLASLTKILATLPMIMKMYDDGVLNLDDKLSQWLPEFRYTNKRDITIKELLLHESGLPAWIPFYKETLTNGLPNPEWYSTTPTDDFSIRVADQLYLRKDYPQKIINRIKTVELGAKKYKYSDLGFILLGKIVEHYYQKPLNLLVEEYFYAPMGINLTFNPLEKYPLQRIAPTEQDNYFRHTTVQGYVHDMAAAMMGGVAGHAGLFGTAQDVYKMMLFFMNKGQTNGVQLLKPETIEAFNQCYSCHKGSRRGAGFDKPNPHTQGQDPTCGCTSASSFGHTGFTGNIAWADPDAKIIYIFLSNRTYPLATENKLSKNSVREKIQSELYKILMRKE